jgi:hypothetical protein
MHRSRCNDSAAVSVTTGLNNAASYLPSASPQCPFPLTLRPFELHGRPSLVGRLGKAANGCLLAFQFAKPEFGGVAGLEQVIWPEWVVTGPSCRPGSDIRWRVRRHQRLWQVRLHGPMMAASAPVSDCAP